MKNYYFQTFQNHFSKLKQKHIKYKKHSKSESHYWLKDQPYTLGFVHKQTTRTLEI